MIFTIEMVLFALYCTLYIYRVYSASGRRRIFTEMGLISILFASVMSYILMNDGSLEAFLSFLLVITMLLIQSFPLIIETRNETIET